MKQFKGVTCPEETLEACTTEPSEALKTWIRHMVDAGLTKDEIVKAVVDDFGEKILAVSPRRGFAWWLWVLPAIGLAIGLMTVAQLWRRRSRSDVRRADVSLPAELAPYLEQVQREVGGSW